MKKRGGFIEIAALILAGIAVLGTGIGYIKINEVVNSKLSIFGQSSYVPVQAQSFYLSGSGITATASSITLTSFKLSDASTTITITDFPSRVGYATIEPGSSKEEQISFSGITQNADGSAALTGVVRGLNFKNNCNSVSAFQKSHAGGVKLVLSNTACFYAQFAPTDATATITKTWTFVATGTPQYSSEPTFTQGTQIIDKTYADSLTFSGAPNASEIQKGIIQLSTPNLLSTGSSTGSTGSRLVVPNDRFNSSSTATTTVPVTGTNGKLDQGFLDLTQPFTLSGGATSTGQTNLASTTLMSGSTTVSGPITFTGTVTGLPNKLFASTFATVTATQNVSTTMATLTLPAVGTLDKVVFSLAQYGVATIKPYFSINGTTVCNAWLGTGEDINTRPFLWRITVQNINSTSSQYIYCEAVADSRVFSGGNGSTTIAESLIGSFNLGTQWSVSSTILTTSLNPSINSVLNAERFIP